MFFGFFTLEATLLALMQSVNSSGTPVAADAAPTFRIYGPSGLMNNGTGTTSAFDSGNVTGMYQASKVVGAADGYARATTYTIRFQWAVSSVPKSFAGTFMVI
jgi:hypothetical protein